MRDAEELNGKFQRRRASINLGIAAFILSFVNSIAVVYLITKDNSDSALINALNNFGKQAEDYFERRATTTNK